MLSTFDLAATLLIHVLSDERGKVLKSQKKCVKNGDFKKVTSN